MCEEGEGVLRMSRHIIVLLLNLHLHLLTRVKCLITNSSNYIHLSGMTWHHLTLCCIVLYNIMDIYVSHNTNQVEAHFSAFQLHERLRLKTRERDKERGRERIEERRGGGRRYLT